MKCPNLNPNPLSMEASEEKSCECWEASEEKSCEYCEKPIGAGHVSRDGFDFCSAECSEQSRDSETCKHCEKPIEGEPFIFWPLGHTPLFFCSVTCQQKSAGAK